MTVRISVVVLVAVVLGCASTPGPAPVSRSPEITTSSLPPKLENHRVIAEGVRGPTRPELLPYVGQRPLVYIKQRNWDAPLPSFDLVVFDDGKVFFEGERCVDAVGFRTGALEDSQLLALRNLLQDRCPKIECPPGKAAGSITHSTVVRVTCQVGESRYEGRFGGISVCGGPDGEDAPRQTRHVARGVIDTTAAAKWLGDVTDPRCEYGTHYVASEIERTLAPVPWKAYAPLPATEPPATGAP